MSIDDSATTVEDVVDTPGTSPTEERRRKARVLYERMVIIQEELKKLEVDISQQKGTAVNEPSQGTGGSEKTSSNEIVDKKNNVTTREDKKQPFMSKLKKVNFDKDMPGRIVALVNKVGHLRKTYEDRSLLMALGNALTLEISETYDEDGNGTLESVMQELLYRFNSPNLIEEAERSLMDLISAVKQPGEVSSGVCGIGKYHSTM